MSILWEPYHEYLLRKKWEEEHPPMPPEFLRKIWMERAIKEEEDIANKIENDKQTNSITNKEP